MGRKGVKILGSCEQEVRRRASRAQCKPIPPAFLSVDWSYKLLAGSNGLITACYQRHRGNWTLYLVIWYSTDTGAGRHTWEPRTIHTLTHTYVIQLHSETLKSFWELMTEHVHTLMHAMFPLSDLWGFSHNSYKNRNKQSINQSHLITNTVTHPVCTDTVKSFLKYF